MSASGPHPLPPAVAERAVEWWLQLQEEPDSAALQQQLQAWRHQHLLHEQAWQRVEAMQQRLVAVAAPHQGLAQQALAPRPAARRRRTVQSLMLLICGGTAAWQMESQTPWCNWAADMRTPRGERRRWTLADGTQLVLQGGSALDMAYSHSERRLLLRAGEVYITSATDILQPARPLLVQTAAGEVRPLGTRFSVEQEEGGHVQVAVFEGAVQLQPQHAPAQVLPAGQQAWMRRDEVSAPTPSHEDDIAWVNGMLVARGMRLDAVLRALQPSSPPTLVCHPAVAARQVSGTYPLADVLRVMQALAELLQLELRTLTRWWGGQTLAIGPRGVI